jgi:hypothetical protein
LLTSVAWKRHLRPFVRLEYVDQQATDPRFAYRRSRAAAGIELVY